MKETKNKVGRPLKYKSNDELKTKIDDYFKSCKGEFLKDKDDNLVLDKYNKPILINQKPLTVTGLALYLGFNSRHSLLNYQDNEEFMHTITRAKSFIEEYAETRLYDKDGCNGAKFNLANNFGWSEKQEITNNTKLNIDSTLTTEEIRKMLKEE